MKTNTPVNDVLKVEPGITALIGSGGKSTLLARLAKELSQSESVLLLTSTHMYPPEGIPLVTGGADDVREMLKHNNAVCAGVLDPGGKLTTPSFTFDEAAALARYVLVEADGSRGLPLKAHAAHEPVIPPGARVIALVGASGFGKPVFEAAHRPALYAKALGISENAIVTPELASRAVKRFPPCGTVVLNQCDTERETALAKRFAQEYNKGAVIAAALMSDEPIKAVWRFSEC